MSERVEFVGCGVISRTESILWRQSRNHCVGHSLGHEHDADGTSGNDIFVYEIPRVGSQPLETREQRLRGHPRGRFSSVAAPAAAAAAAAGQYMLHKLTQKSSHPTIGDGCSRLSPFVRVEGTSIAACVASRTAADRCISIVHCASSSCCSCSRRIVHDYVRRRGRRAATVSQFGLLSRRRHISLISSTHLALLVASVRWISGFCCRISLSLSLSLSLTRGRCDERRLSLCTAISISLANHSHEEINLSLCIECWDFREWAGERDIGNNNNKRDGMVYVYECGRVFIVRCQL